MRACGDGSFCTRPFLSKCPLIAASTPHIGQWKPGGGWDEAVKATTRSRTYRLKEDSKPCLYLLPSVRLWAFYL